MDRETINRVELLDTGELFLGLKGRGKSLYQYIYREAAGVYWDQGKCGFKSTPIKEWPCSQWYKQIVSVVRSGLGVELVLADDVVWSDVPEQERIKIQREKDRAGLFSFSKGDG